MQIAGFDVKALVQCQYVVIVYNQSPLLKIGFPKSSRDPNPAIAICIFLNLPYILLCAPPRTINKVMVIHTLNQNYPIYQGRNGTVSLSAAQQFLINPVEAGGVGRKVSHVYIYNKLHLFNQTSILGSNCGLMDKCSDKLIVNLRWNNLFY